MIQIPLPLRTAIESGNCVLFLGSGIGHHALAPDGSSAPVATDLARELADHFRISVDATPDLRAVAGIVELRHGRPELHGFIQRRLADLTPDDTLRWLFTRRWSAIFTTNYDSVIERAYELLPSPPQTPLPCTISSDLVRHDARFEVPIIHIHGALFGQENPQIVITEDDYSKFSEKRRMLFDFMRVEFATCPVLYVGYSNSDQDWRALINDLSAEFYPTPLPQSFRIARNTDPLEAELLDSKNIHTLDASLDQLVEALAPILAPSTEDSHRYLAAAYNVPSDLKAAFDANPAPTARLLSSWTYVNQAAFHEPPNISSFLRGNRPNWGLIGRGEVFERDIFEPIFEDLLDFATSASQRPRAITVLGPAGYGVTTLLMTLAAALVNEKAGPAFMLNSGFRAHEGDIEFATSLFDKRPFFFLPNGSDHALTVRTMLRLLQETKKPAFFVLGERLNEWRQGHGRLNTKEYQIDPLSDPEIDRLLDLLTRHSELGVLSALPRHLQVSAIRQKHGKELLVALREATEGRSFDAILEDEFRGINSPSARRLYLTVCCFHQYDSYVRDSLLATVAGIDIATLYENTGPATEGVVIYDCVNEARQTYAARTRHRTIATIVWERCAAQEEKDEIVLSSLHNLNLNYGVDKDAFEHLLRSDRVVDQIRTLDSKIQFFDTACKKDPQSPYVRQHYARMLLRQNKTDLALSQIDAAIQIDSQVRVLHHTKGMVLMDLALNTESVEIARRRLAQAEESFRKGLAIYHRDEYCYQGLAQLFLGWARRTPNEEESAHYISKAEEIIGEGLKVVRVRYGLWIESSNVQRYLGDQPSRIAALDKAVRDAPGSVVSRYLLGRVYRQDGRIDEALEVLEPVIKDHPDEFRPAIEYALCLLSKTRVYDQPIAVLRLSTLYGLSDARFIATLGGMLFMAGKFTEGKEIFEETLKRDMSTRESNETNFTPPNLQHPDTTLRLEGTVTSLRPGYAFIEANGYPRFLCPGSKFNGLVLSLGMRISFEPAFSARGAQASDPQAVPPPP
jgi:tetratricopeptide (TPR) repeat protein